jgi:hypothetical protein
MPVVSLLDRDRSPSAWDDGGVRRVFRDSGVGTYPRSSGTGQSLDDLAVDVIERRYRP